MLAIILSPVGRWIIAAALSAALIAGAYIKGRMDRAALDQSAALRATVAELNRQLTETKAVADAAQARADQRAADVTDAQGKVAAYERELAKRTGRVCVLGDGDARSLRDIIGPVPPAPPSRPADLR